MHRLKPSWTPLSWPSTSSWTPLFRDEAMDIASDITVMETLLAQEGLAGDQPDLH